MQPPRRPTDPSRRRDGTRPSDRPARKEARAAKPAAKPASTIVAKRPSGYAARELAAGCLSAILDRGRTLEDAFEAAATPGRTGPLEPRDRALARLIVMTVLRRKGELVAVVSSFLGKPLPADTGRLWPILLSASAQLLFLDTPPHAAISLAVDQCRADHKARRFDKLTNAVLRKVSTSGREVLAGLDPVTVNVPSWLFARWVATYGEGLAREIAAASLREAALDLSTKSDGDAWAERLGGILLSAGSFKSATVRIGHAGRIEDLAGFSDGAWWVQDAAAAIPARLIGPAAGLHVADLCAAPGGKTAQLAAAGAHVTAVDQSPPRLVRLRENLARLALEADVVEADIASWEPGRTFDAVLLDAPCTATGTIRRHPDILHHKRKDEIADRVIVQGGLLDSAARLVRPGGLLIYCTCSLEPEEGPQQIARFLAESHDFTRVPLDPLKDDLDQAWITPDGDLRTLPCHLALADTGLSGIDGFYAARLRKAG